MTKPVISIKKLGKCYILGSSGRERYRALREVIANSFKNLIKAKNKKTDLRELWALKDVSFDVEPGQVLGIIGRNGAGKSTLLKLLSQITEPTTGEIHLRGRVASLLEVGTGFHPELTGRENIFMNGAILGMTKVEIKRKFDKIVSFAEVEKFLDTPVKRYSNGMIVRLAFAVAAHLESEILLIDEVLAVGDAEFQKKCLGKMEDVTTKEGRTVIFVSHNMGAVRRLCQRGILLSYGKLLEDDVIASVIDTYLTPVIEGNKNLSIEETIKKLPENGVFKLHGIEIKQDNQSPMYFISSKDIKIEFNYEVFQDTNKLFLNFELWDTEGACISESFHNADGTDPLVRKGNYTSSAVIPANILAPIAYELRIYLGIFGDRNFIDEPIIIIFHVYSDGKKNMAYGKRPLAGRVHLPIDWHTQPLVR